MRPDVRWRTRLLGASGFHGFRFPRLLFIIGRVAPDSIAEVQVALRVLNAITAGVDPERHDVEELRGLAPDCPDLPVDDLAFEVVRRAVKRRAAGVRQ